MSDTGTRRADVLILGAGVAGLAAALEAAQAGMAVTIVDSEPAYGGASAISGGGCCIVGTPVQHRLGIQDNVELALTDWSNCGGPTADLVWARRYLERSFDYVYRWCEQLGLRWENDLRWYAGNSVPRWHKPSGGGGAIVSLIRAALEKYSITWLLASTATDLIVEDGVVMGAAISSRSGHHHVRADATVVATGGFANNRLMLRELGGPVGKLPHLLSGSNHTSNGTGHDLLRRAGALLENLDHLWVYPIGVPNYRFPGGQRGVALRKVEDEIWVNKSGQRFHDENRRGAEEGSRALLQQPGQRSWGIFDIREAEKIVILDDGYFGTAEYTVPARREEFLRHCPHIWQAEDLCTLAGKAGLPSMELQATVRDYNSLIEKGVPQDPMTGRDLTRARPIIHPPYFAVQYFPMVQKNFGGVRTDLSCRVRSTAGNTIPGLYAAGEVAGMAGGTINGRAALEGTMFGPCIFSGRIAGQAAAADLATRGGGDRSLNAVSSA